MEVKMIAHTDAGESVCGVASKNCVSETMPELGDDDLLKSMKGAIASGHESVLEHWSATFAVSGVSRALTHQLVRHRIASYSQQSQRYVNMEGFDYVMPESIINSTKKVSYRMEPDMFENMEWVKETPREAYEYIMRDIADLYHELLNAGIPEEDARYILPNACTTNIVVTMNARQLRHLFALRCCERAQKEIRELANKMLEECIKVAPNIFSDAGPSCVQRGYCVEGKKSCGLRPTMNELLKAYGEVHEKP